MAVNISARLRRTQRGQDEIRQKSHTLSQNERLILAIVDGFSPTETLKRKLRGMVDRRFKLAVADLKAKGYIEEAVPITDSAPEILDALIVERFVRQDPLDPVSPDALSLQPESRQRAGAGVELEIAQDKSAQPPGADGGGVDFYLPLEIQEAPALRTSNLEGVASKLITENDSDQWQGLSGRGMKRARRSRYIQIGYWLLFAGLVCAMLLVALVRLH